MEQGSSSPRHLQRAFCICFGDADEGELSSGSALFTMREEEVCIAGGAEIDPEDLILLDSFLFDLGDVNRGAGPPSTSPSRSGQSEASSSE